MFQIRNSPLVYDGTGFLGVKEIMDQSDANKKDTAIKEMERRHKEKMEQVRKRESKKNLIYHED